MERLYGGDEILPKTIKGQEIVSPENGGIDLRRGGIIVHRNVYSASPLPPFIVVWSKPP